MGAEAECPPFAVGDAVEVIGHDDLKRTATVTEYDKGIYFLAGTDGLSPRSFWMYRSWAAQRMRRLP